MAEDEFTRALHPEGRTFEVIGRRVGAAALDRRFGRAGLQHADGVTTGHGLLGDLHDPFQGGHGVGRTEQEAGDQQRGRDGRGGEPGFPRPPTALAILFQAFEVEPLIRRQRARRTFAAQHRVLGCLEDEAVARVRLRSEQLPQRSLFALIGDAVENAQSQVVEFLIVFRLAHGEV